MMKSLVRIIKNSIALLTKSERHQLFFLLIAIALMSFFELVGVASIFPFMSVALDPDSIETKSYLHFVYQKLNFTSHKDFLLFLGAGTICSLIIGNILRAIANYMLLKFAHIQAHSLGYRIFQSYLKRPYESHLLNNSSQLVNVVISEVGQLITGVFLPLLKAFGRLTTSLCIISMLIILDPMVAIIMAIFLGLAYFIVFHFFKRKIMQLSKERGEMGAARFKSLSEASGGIKEVKLMGKESFFLNEFSNPSKRFAYGQAHNAIVGDLPRYILEVIAFGGIISLVMYLLAKKGAQEAITLSSLYAFAGYKMIPSLQEIFNSLTKVKFNYPIVKLIKSSIDETFEENLGSEKVTFKESIELSNLSFQYKMSDSLVLKDINLKIKFNSTVGIIGPTGSGKTTLVDLILGLLGPTSGCIKVDGVPLSKSNLRSWQDQIGYVPQFIYLTDDTIKANIAFGIRDDQIDLDKVKKAAELAQISSFIETDLPLGYQTIVGDRGVRLSGGQRQRIGVARALYNNPSLIVFDEATSALDNETEKALMDSIESLSGKRTIIMIAHRLTTIEKANQVIKIDKGQIVDRELL